MRHLLAPAALAATLACGPAAGEVRVAAGAWLYELSGSARDGSRYYDFEDDLALQAEGRRSLQLDWDTPPGWWPDVAAGYTRIGASGDHQEEFTLTAGGIPIATQTRTIVTSAGFDDAEIALRYPFAVGPVRVAAGVVVKRLRGELVIEDSTEPAPSRQHYDETFPQVHAQLRWPATRWLALAVSMQGITHDGSAAREWRGGAEARVKWLRAEVGWQEKLYDIAVGDYALDARVEGWLVRLGAAW